MMFHPHSQDLFERFLLTRKFVNSP